jgi:hypothetical protein
MRTLDSGVNNFAHFVIRRGEMQKGGVETGSQAKGAPWLQLRQTIGKESESRYVGDGCQALMTMFGL